MKIMISWIEEKRMKGISLKEMNRDMHLKKTNIQRSYGIRQWTIKLCTSPITINKITPPVN